MPNFFFLQSLSLSLSLFLSLSPPAPLLPLHAVSLKTSFISQLTNWSLAGVVSGSKCQFTVLLKVAVTSATAHTDCMDGRRSPPMALKLAAGYQACTPSSDVKWKHVVPAWPSRGAGSGSNDASTWDND